MLFSLELWDRFDEQKVRDEMDILGQYDYDNFTLTNPEIADLDTYNLTSLHEYTHMILSMQSNVGFLMYCLKRITPPTEKCDDYRIKKVLTDFLEKHYLKVQEGMAVCTECVAIILGVVDKDCSQYIQELQYNNKKYYDYIRPLIQIVRLMQEESDRNVVLETFMWIFQVALYAMNSEIHTIDAENFKNQRKLDKLCSTAGFSDLFLPNKRFKNALKTIRNAKDCKSVSDTLSEFLINKKYAKTLNDCEKMLYDIKEFVFSIFKNSPYIFNYRSQLESIQCEEVYVKDAYTRQLLATYDDDFVRKYSKRASFDDVKECLSNPNNLVFVLADVVSGLKQALKYAIEEDRIKNFVEPSNECLLLFSFSTKEIKNALVTSDEMSYILKNTDAPIVVNYKYYDYARDEIINHIGINKDIYIYCDRTYYNFIPYLDNWNGRDLYYRWLQYEQVMVLIIRIKDNRYQILPMTIAVADEAQADINKRKNLIMFEGDEVCDGKVVTEGRKYILDIIISYLLFGRRFYEETK